MFSLVRLVVSLAIAFSFDAFLPVSGNTQTLARIELPPTIQIVSTLDLVTQALLQRSDTFRAQCARIAQTPHVRVVVVMTPHLTGAAMRRARTSIRRYSTGAIHALVELPIVGEHAELLAHEFEHVVEQMEGIDLAERLRAGDEDVAQTDGYYETARAKAAGLAAMNEMYAETDPAITAARRVLGRWLRSLGARAAADRSARAMLPR